MGVRERVWGLRQGLLGILAGVALCGSLGWGVSGLDAAKAQSEPNSRMTIPPVPVGAVAGPGVQGRASDGSGLIAFTSPGPEGMQWLYLIDTRTQAFAVYRVDGHEKAGMVKLAAARKYRWDLMLTEYNNQPPQPSAIESSVLSGGAKAESR